MTAKVLSTETTTGGAVYAIVRRLSDDYLLNDADGAFAAAPADPYLSLTELAVEKGAYTVSEGRTPWTDGTYRVTYFKQSGGSPSPVADSPPLAVESVAVLGDTRIDNYRSIGDLTAIKVFTLATRTDLRAVKEILAEFSGLLKTVNSSLSSLDKSQRRP